MPTNAPLPPVRCSCGAIALVKDDEQAGVALCTTCWIKKYLPQGK